jgi:DNA topoisomerase-2
MTKLDIEKTYKSLTQREQILLRPDTVIGSIENNTECMWIVNEDNTLERKEIEYNPGFMKLPDEIIVNVCDQMVKPYEENNTIVHRCTCMKVSVDQENGIISVYNDGDGVPVSVHKEKKVHVPELIFGTLNTSSNYDDDKKKITGGRNGLGAKAVNIFSEFFTIETVDHREKKKYIQTFRDNLSIIEKPQITTCKNKPYTLITFKPDLKRFGLDTISDEHVSLIRKRVFDTIATAPNGLKVKVYFNETLLPVNTSEKYMLMYYPECDKVKKVFQEVNERWKVGVMFIPDSRFPHISYVNSICTTKGGTHVKYIEDQIFKKLTECIKSKYKDVNRLNYNLIRDNLVLFVSCLIENPAFSSQTKEELTTKSNKFGSKCDLDNKFLDKVAKLGIVEHVVESLKSKESSVLKQSDGKVTTRLKGIPKLADADFAGNAKEGHKCGLILTEGDSALASAYSGLAVVGRKYYGAFPLRGKLLNVRDTSPTQVNDNTELTNIKKILGLQHGKKYTSINELRYGYIILFVDADVDGTHIAGLLMNFIHYYWPELMKLNPSFIRRLTTPVLKATNSKTKKVKTFYNLPTYNEWKDTVNINDWKIKYYKGLGTSTSTEAKEYFEDVSNRLINYRWDDYTNDSINLAFKKELADKRKEWLGTYSPANTLDNTQKEVSLTEFINKELIHFSYSDNERSIPCAIDGFKPSQRKVLYASYLSGLDKKDKELKVSQLSGFVSYQTCYHHGEASLNNTIIDLAQDFVGSNNINVLLPIGQFGTRITSKDSSAPRYIFTAINPIMKCIFRKEDSDILEHLHDDGTKIEPNTYLPIIPMVLVNGARGIGTGYSTNIPAYNPKDIISNLRKKLAGEELDELVPYYRGFTGKICKIAENKYLCKGNYSIKFNTVEITELPVQKWTGPYKEFLEKLIDKKIIDDYKDNCTDTTVSFKVIFKTDILKELIKEEKLESTLGLTDTINTSNMHLHTSPYNANESTIKKYNSINEIIEDFYEVRLVAYEKRKELQLQILEHEMKILKFKVQFILHKLDNTIVIENKKYDDIIEKLEELQYPKLGTHYNDTNVSFNYITNIQLFSLTKEKKEELEKQFQNKVKQFEELQKKTIQEIWLEELDELEKEL